MCLKMLNLSLYLCKVNSFREGFCNFKCILKRINDLYERDVACNRHGIY